MPSQVPQPNDGEEQPDRETPAPSSGRASPIDTEKMQMLRAMREQLISNRTTITEKDMQLDEARQSLEDARRQLEEANLKNESLLNQNKQLETKVRVTREMSQLGKQMAQLKDLEVKSLKLEIQGLMQKVGLLCDKIERDRQANNTEDFNVQKHKALMDELNALKEENRKQKELIEKMEKECLHPTAADSKLAEKIFVLSNLFSELEKTDNEISFLELVGERMSSLLITGKEEQESTDGTVPVPLHKCFKVSRLGDTHIVAVNTRDALLFIKDLLISQRKLEEDVKSLKEVNNQLKLTVMEQERELSSINIELTSAWGMINKVKNQHGILHNAREAHRHDLREKRKLLNKLKEELEFSHQKLLSLRVMNKDSQAEWQSMRDERDSRLLSGSDGVGGGPVDTINLSEDEKTIEVEAVPEEVEILESAACTAITSPEESRVASPTESEALPSNDEITDTENVKVLEREERLKLLEDQCKFLYARVLRSTHRSILLAERLSALHDQYGSNDEAGTPKASTPAPETPKERTPPAGEQ